MDWLYASWEPTFPGQEAPQVRLWCRTDPELGLLGFLTRQDRDAFSNTDHPGPFRRIVAKDGRTILQNEDFHGMVSRLAYDAGIKR